MKLYVKEKLFSLHRKFYIKDESDNNVYEISSEFISIGDKTKINDMNGNTIAFIEQEIFHLTPHYNVYINGELSFKIEKKFQLFKNDYSLSNGYRVDGNIFMLDFTIYDNIIDKETFIKYREIIDNNIISVLWRFFFEFCFNIIKIFIFIYI